MRAKAFKLQNIKVMSFKIGFLFLVPADLALICWLKVETSLTNLTYGKPKVLTGGTPAYRRFFATLIM